MRVGIVGAGITGLALTHYLAERDVPTVTVEAAPEPGGVIDSRVVDGHVLEAGPQRMRQTPAIEALAEAVGIAGDFIEAGDEDLYVYTGGKLRRVPFDARAFLDTDVLSWRGKLRFLAEPLTRQSRPEETVEEVFVRKFGREAYERFVGPLYGGIYGSDPAAMPAEFALTDLIEREKRTHSLLRAFHQRVGQGQRAPAVTVEGGLQRFPEAIYDHHSDHIHLDTTAESVERDPDGDGFLIHTAPSSAGADSEGPPETPVRVDEVVLTTPAHVTARLLEPITPDVAALATLTYNPLALVYLESEAEREGFGYQVGYDESLRTLGVTWNDSMFGREHLYTVFLGGMHDPGILEEDDASLGRVAAEEFETVMGAAASVVDVARLEPGFPAYDHTWSGLESLSLPEGIHLATNYTARMGIPSRVREAAELAGRLDGTPEH